MERRLFREMTIGIIGGADGQRMITEDVLNSGIVSGDGDGSSSDDSETISVI